MQGSPHPFEGWRGGGEAGCVDELTVMDGAIGASFGQG